MRDNPWILDILRWVGAAWLLWLAWQIATAPSTAPAAARPPMTLLQSALFQWVNPKAWIIAAGAIAAYGGGLAAALTLAALFAIAAFGSLLAWAALGAGTARWLRDPGAIRWFNRAMAALLVASLVPVLLG